MTRIIFGMGCSALTGGIFRSVIESVSPDENVFWLSNCSLRSDRSQRPMARRSNHRSESSCEFLDRLFWKARMKGCSGGTTLLQTPKLAHDVDGFGFDDFYTIEAVRSWSKKRDVDVGFIIAEPDANWLCVARALDTLGQSLGVTAGKDAEDEGYLASEALSMSPRSGEDILMLNVDVSASAAFNSIASFLNIRFKEEPRLNISLDSALGRAQFAASKFEALSVLINSKQLEDLSAVVTA